jgi:hypothetical protein
MMMRFSLLSIAVTVLFLSGCGLFSNPDQRLISLKGSEPNEHEKLYYNLAGAIASEKPCHLISPYSYILAPGTAPLNTSGHAVQLQKSRCIANVARLSMRPELCDQVQTASTILYSGTRYNSERCREEAEAQQRVSGNIIDSEPIVQLAGLTNDEINEAMISLELFPNRSVLEAYRAEREDQFIRCANRYVIYSEMFFRKIDEFPDYGSSGSREEMQSIEWQKHPYITTSGFTSCFLADGASHWSARGVGIQDERRSAGQAIMNF